jgi:hypothetical protein
MVCTDFNIANSLIFFGARGTVDRRCARDRRVDRALRSRRHAIATHARDAARVRPRGVPRVRVVARGRRAVEGTRGGP